MGDEKVAARGRSSSAHVQNHLRVLRTRRWEPRVPAAECFLSVHFQRRTREAGPAGEDGVTAGPEARAAAGQRPRRPPRLPTNFLQVGGQGHALGSGLDLRWLDSWKGVRVWVTLEKPQLWSRTSGPISAILPRGRSLCPGFSQRQGQSQL